MKQKEFKEKMPECAAFIEDLCQAFGTEAIHGQIRKGLNGEPTFWAKENGHEIGTPVDSGAEWRVTWNEHGVAVAEKIKRG
ncbi:hypothetical protein EDC30_104275 [Paucimonas lemoignei]|uniref:Uncharacterized protein n=1 Tax=Paucimonas lemoignei TaxID=29443 RepID=A0A4R3HYS3_PAULE|nr:hypothetical protein [Paucimonas lemoignei]TCS37471.1 hypothetical protein EDC30_104275 [Paucimonas lemoignei]